MKNNVNCKTCIWFDVCGGCELCDDYCPGSADGINELAEQEYRMDLEGRHAEYQSHVEEQNS